MVATFERIAILDGGMAGMRFVHAVRELAAEPAAPLRSIALVPPGGAAALAAREADEVHELPEPIATLGVPALATALRSVRADALWVGWGEAAGRVEIAELCEASGIVHVGPPAATMRRLADPAVLAELAERRGFASTRRPPGDATPTGTRRLTLPIAADGRGHLWVFGPFDESIRHGDEVVLAESACARLSDALAQTLRATLAQVARTLPFVGTGYAEVRYDPARSRFELLALHPHLAPAHALAEVVTGADLVKVQLALARGDALPPAPPPGPGHAVAAWLRARDPDADFTGRRGVLERFRLPTGPGIRVDTGVEKSDGVGSPGDATLALIVAHGRDRHEALGRLRRALTQTDVVLSGGAHDESFVLSLLDRHEVEAGDADERWLDDLRARRLPAPATNAAIAVVVAALEAEQREHRRAVARFGSTAARGRPEVPADEGTSHELRWRDRRVRLGVERVGLETYVVTAGGTAREVHVERRDAFDRRLRVGSRRHRVLVAPAGEHGYRIEVDGALHVVERTTSGWVRSPAPAVVVHVDVAVGDRVSAGQRLVVLEAMKLEMPIVAPSDGRVGEVRAIANTQVAGQARLVRVVPLADAERTEGSAAEDLVFPADEPPTEPTALVRTALERLRQHALGFDVGPARVRAALAVLDAHADEATAHGVDVVAAEHGVLGVFADLEALFGRHPTSEPVGEETTFSDEWLLTYLRAPSSRPQGVPDAFLDQLARAVAHHGVVGLEPGPALDDALYRVFVAHERFEARVTPVLALLARALARADRGPAPPAKLLLLLARVGELRHSGLHDAAVQAHHRLHVAPALDRLRRAVYTEADARVAALTSGGEGTEGAAHLRWLVDCPQPLVGHFTAGFAAAPPERRARMLEVLVRRYYRLRALRTTASRHDDGVVATARYDFEGRAIAVIALHASFERVEPALAEAALRVAEAPTDHDVVVDLFLSREGAVCDPDEVQSTLAAAIVRVAIPRPLRRLVVAVTCSGAGSTGPATLQYFTYRPTPEGGYAEERVWRGLHPMIGKRLEVWRLAAFDVERLPSAEDLYLFRGVARSNPKDERLFLFAEVRDSSAVADAAGRVVELPQLERAIELSLAAVRDAQASRPPAQRCAWNRILLYVWPPLLVARAELEGVLRRHAAVDPSLGLQKVLLRARMADPTSGALEDVVVHLSNPGGKGLVVAYRAPAATPIEPLDAYGLAVVRLRQRGLVYPYEIVRMLTAPAGSRGDLPPGTFTEHDLDATGERLVPVERAPGGNVANVVVGILRNVTPAHPEGMERVVLLGDPSRAMGALAEAECRRIEAALALARGRRVPLEWFALSAGAKISMTSGTENMDWIARVLRRIVEYTQVGGELNVIVTGINVGAQPYWNAEATMLMHTRGILVMMPESAMVLTGKQALDYSGSVSAPDNRGIGGYERVMGPNGQAQYWARDLPDACRILLRYYEHTYVAPGEPFPRRVATTDPVDRDVRRHPHGGDFATVGDVLSSETNPGRKRPFDIRRVLESVVDRDHPPLERWGGMAEAEIAVVWDAHVGGYPVLLLGIESRPLPRLGVAPADGPEHWTAGTLFPLASKKVARALNAASGNRPAVVLANLSGFDGSPESMRRLQLEYGAEIGRAVVNFHGPIVFCVVSRYHGGAFVVFSRALNEHLEAAALEGTFASVIGGAPAAAVVFASEVSARTRADARVQALERAIAGAAETERPALRARLEEVRAVARSEHLGAVAEEFDGVHSVERARAVGSLDVILPPERLRPYLVDAIERGMARWLATRAAT